MSGAENETGTGGRSVLAQRATMRGEIEAPGTVEIGGLFDGRIKADAAVIEAWGTMTGTVAAERVTIRGTFTGEIETEELRVLSGATVSGKVMTKRLLVEAGANVDFTCKMTATG
jgi:cytoskeletal protein CcmA (bactofilin family)